ncbi:hypothetical protein BpHYR1_005281 [Brachionus plicatilis]|uniref:Uncharacterized protein n=1 Tax=Brachionus plicatilis TaxID=10195 RepID=A0A3M7PI68_BRAPC|nr:hypothetical protein BpHYR1_005281 [Brachionus plicatilis]
MEILFERKTFTNILQERETPTSLGCTCRAVQLSGANGNDRINRKEEIHSNPKENYKDNVLINLMRALISLLLKTIKKI